MRFNDAVMGSVLVIFALAEIAYTFTFPSLFGQSYGPDLFPRIIGFGLITSGLCLIFRGIRHKRQAGVDARWIEPGPWIKQPHLRVNLVLVVLSLIGYILFAEWLGFILTSLIILTVLLYRLGSSFFSAIIIAVASTAALQLIFAKLLLVPLPAGLLLGLVY